MPPEWSPRRQRRAVAQIEDGEKALLRLVFSEWFALQAGQQIRVNAGGLAHAEDAELWQIEAFHRGAITTGEDPFVGDRMQRAIDAQPLLRAGRQSCGLHKRMRFKSGRQHDEVRGKVATVFGNQRLPLTPDDAHVWADFYAAADQLALQSPCRAGRSLLDQSVVGREQGHLHFTLMQPG